MLMIVLGAGASADSVRQEDLLDSPQRPPLANELFDPRFRRYVAEDLRYAGTLISDCAASVARGEDVETFLNRQTDDAAGSSRIRTQLLAIRYYLRDLIMDVTEDWAQAAAGALHHARLLQWLDPHLDMKREGVLIVTFNYDLLIEAAFRDVFNREFAQLDDWVDSPRYSIFKLHGSVNWERQINAPSKAARNFVRLETISNLADQREFFLAGQPREEGIACAPALAVPVRTKSAFMCPEYHLHRLTKVLPKVDRVVSIGWRAAEEHFLDLIASQTQMPRWLVVDRTPQDAREIAQRLNNRLIAAADAAPVDGFSAFVEKFDEARPWLLGE